MTCYPVIIPTLCRYEKLKKCIGSLSNNTIASETELIIGLDYPPSDKYEEGWKKIKEYIPTISGFKTVTCLERTENYGSSKNSIDLENYALSKYDAYIYSEDDNIFSPYFLQFMNDGLEKYKNDDSVFAVCGYSYPIDWKTDKDCILQQQYFSAWGYGIWKDREEKYRAEIKNDFLRKKINANEIKRLKRSPANFVEFMGHAFVDTIPIYDISRSFYTYLNALNILMPSKTLVTNDGWDGSGEHCQKNTTFDLSNKNRNGSVMVNINSVESVFSNQLELLVYSLKPGLSFIKAEIKYFIIRIFGIQILRKIKNLTERGFIK